MAQIIPDSFKSSKGVDAGTKKVLRALNLGIEETSIIIWAQPKISIRGSQRLNPDIVIYSPYHGMFVIEVKRWSLAQILKADPSQWHIKKGKEIETCDSPWVQAKSYNDNIRTAMKKIDALLNKAEGRHKGKPLLPVGHAACFPNISEEELSGKPEYKELFNHCGQYILSDELTKMSNSIDGADGSRLLNRLAQDLPYTYDRELTDDQMIALKGLLFPEIVAIQATKAGRFRRIALDTNQENLVRTIDGGHIAIRGVAGSGKSLILASKARLLSEQHPNWKILVTCYNVPLCKSLEFYVKSFGSPENPIMETKRFTAPASLPKGISVVNFHKLAAAFLREHEQAYPEKINKEELRKAAQFREMSEAEFEAAMDERNSNIIGSTLENLIQTKTGLAGRFDAIFIDEAQDFHESWLRCMTLLLKGESNFLVLAEDPNQKIYPRSCGYKQAGIKPKKRIKLPISYRSTKSIVTCASRLVVAQKDKWDDFYKDFIEENDGNLDQSSVFREVGEAPSIAVNSSRAEMLVTIAEKIRAMVDSGECKYSDFAILYLPGEPKKNSTDGSIQNDIFSGQPGWKIIKTAESLLLAESIPCFNLSDDDEKRKDHLRDDRVTLSTMGLVKGLEFEHVFLMGLENFPWAKRSTRENASYIYVGMTRARSSLLLHSTLETSYVNHMKKCFNEAMLT
jgi:hypothetical protein